MLDIPDGYVAARVEVLEQTAYQSPVLPPPASSSRTVHIKTPPYIANSAEHRSVLDYQQDEFQQMRQEQANTFRALSTEIQRLIRPVVSPSYSPYHFHDLVVVDGPHSGSRSVRERVTPRSVGSSIARVRHNAPTPLSSSSENTKKSSPSPFTKPKRFIDSHLTSVLKQGMVESDSPRRTISPIRKSPRNEGFHRVGFVDAKADIFF